MRRARALAALLALAASRPSPAHAQDVPDSLYVREHYVKRVLRIPMRDGARLFTIAYLPRDASPARRYPILLQRTPFSIAPYDSAAYPATLGPSGTMLRDGYIFVAQEVRGRYRSEGTFENVRPLLDDDARRRDPAAVDEATDAYDTIEWLVHRLDGADGRVGLFGISYGGFYAAAAELSRHGAIVASSLQAPVTDFWFEDFHHNGALAQSSLPAFAVFGAPRGAPTASHWWLPEYQRLSDAVAGDDDYARQLALGPLRDIGARFLSANTWWRAIGAHPDYDAFWRARAVGPRLRGIAHPVLVVGGWFDAENLRGSLEAYRALRAGSPRASVTLAMGPFGHRGWGARDVVHTVHGNLYFGDSLEARYQRDVEAAFFRAHLKGDARAVAPSGALVFDTGRNRWSRFDAWPAAAAVDRVLHLGRDGSLDAGGGPRGAVAFTSDPAHPVPARCHGSTIEDGSPWSYMSDDQRCFTGRPDVATFQTGVLAADVTVAGAPLAHVVMSTTGTDADVVVTLVDVYPPDMPDHPYRADTAVHLAGYQQLVRGEIVRGRYRRSFGAPVPFRPGVPTVVDVRLPDVFHTFRKGHRIMVHVQGSWFPLFDRNPQRFVPSIYDATATDFTVARHRVIVGGAAGSVLRLPVLP